MKTHDVVIGLVKIPVKDFAAATRYYREVLGLEEEFAVEEYGWAQYRVGGAPLCLYLEGKGGGDGSPGGDTGLHLAVSDARGLFETLEQRGAETLHGMEEADDGGVFFTVKDLDGNTFKVSQQAE